MRKYLFILAFVAPVAFGQAQFERFLVPIYLPGETSGGFGSRWVSELRIMNIGPGAAQIENYGIGCRTGVCFPETLPVNTSAPGDRVRPGIGGVPAAFLLVKPEYARQLVFQARVRDVSRENERWGTWLPVVHESEAVRDRLDLLSIPIDSRYRQTLRIYSFDLALGAVSVFVPTQNGISPQRCLVSSRTMTHFLGNSLWILRTQRKTSLSTPKSAISQA